MNLVRLGYALGIVSIVLFLVLMLADVTGVALNFWVYFSVLVFGGISIAVAAACND